ncbi:MAG TPA: threonine synthase [Bacteroidales bacterium]|nr:threonine synthase [Bacteroidales bacterium]
MKYFSTRDTNQQFAFSLRDAVLKGLAPDGGLFMPAEIPVLSADTLKKMPQMPLPELAFHLLNPFLQEDIAPHVLAGICNEAFNFEIPVRQLTDGVFCLELFHGPTLAFKDVGARFMARLLPQLNNENKPLKVVVATSGDTGSAVASGFHNVEGIEVFVLFPKGKVSPAQRMQLCSWGNNITAIEIDGSFDDCQRHVKTLLSDENALNHQLITSANSINIARLLPQMVYYAWLWSRLDAPTPVVSVPSGNFGNLTAGLMARAMGISINKFVASTNVNDVFPAFLHSGKFVSRPSVATISNAMDVGNPSNFERMLHLFNGDVAQMRKHISAFSFSDDQTRNAVAELWKNHAYIADPHAAVGYLGLMQYIETCKFTGNAAFLATAHPAKFAEVVEACIETHIVVPPRLEAFGRKKDLSTACKNDYAEVRSMVLEHRGALS